MYNEITRIWIRDVDYRIVSRAADDRVDNILCQQPYEITNHETKLC